MWAPVPSRSVLAKMLVSSSAHVSPVNFFNAMSPPLCYNTGQHPINPGGQSKRAVPCLRISSAPGRCSVDVH
eukprot:3228953-Pyramimonas_sp.AAC.1